MRSLLLSIFMVVLAACGGGSGDTGVTVQVVVEAS
jgi:hypothetical protein